MFDRLTVAQSRQFVQGGMTEAALDRALGASTPKGKAEVASSPVKASGGASVGRNAMILDKRVGWDLGALLQTLRAWKDEPRYKSKTEAAFPWFFFGIVHPDTVLCYEAITFRIGPRLHYTPDFVAVDLDGSIHLIEVKGGHQWAKDRVRFKASRAAYPDFPLSVWVLDKGRWTEEIIDA